jgi:hypothetical protein
MKRQIINEGLDYQDLVGQIKPIITVDEYAAKMGKDSDIITLSFIMNSEAAGNDIVDWFERGYEWVLDASLGEGEIAPGKYIVFVEMNRRSTAPARILELLSDLETLTDIPVKDWTIQVDEEEHEPDENVLKQVMTLSPHEYRESEDTEEVEEKMNEMRGRAGIEPKNIFKEQDKEIKAFKAMAGL